MAWMVGELTQLLGTAFHVAAALIHFGWRLAASQVSIANAPFPHYPETVGDAYARYGRALQVCCPSSVAALHQNTLSCQELCQNALLAFVAKGRPNLRVHIYQFTGGIDRK
jgi:hypothetical protein